MLMITGHCSESPLGHGNDLTRFISAVLDGLNRVGYILHHYS